MRVSTTFCGEHQVRFVEMCPMCRTGLGQVKGRPIRSVVHPVGVVCNNRKDGQCQCGMESRLHDFSKGRKCSRCHMDSADSMGSFCVRIVENPEINCAVDSFEIFRDMDGFHIAVQIQGPKLRCQFVMRSPFASRESAEKWLRTLVVGKEEWSTETILAREG